MPLRGQNDRGLAIAALGINPQFFKVENCHNIGSRQRTARCPEAA